MSKLFLVNINMNGNEIQNVVLHPLATPPANATIGRVYYDTVDHLLKTFNGTTWDPAGAVLSVNKQTGAVTIAKSDVGLGNVDNKSESTIKSDFTGFIADGNTGFVTGDEIYEALANKQAKITASGILKGDGSGGVTAATAGTDYVTPANYNPDSATAAMTQSVGVDSNGKLWTAPGGGGTLEVLREITLTEDVASVELSTDSNGNAFELIEAFILMRINPTSANPSSDNNLAIRYNYNTAAYGRPISLSRMCRASGITQEGTYHIKGSNTYRGFFDVIASCTNSTTSFCYGDYTYLEAPDPTRICYLDKFWLHAQNSSKMGTGSTIMLMGVRR